MRRGNTTCQTRAVGSSMVLLARIIDDAGRPIRAADVRHVDCIVREVNSCVREIYGFCVERCEVLLPVLVKDASWTVDEVGYNFRHDITRVAEFVGPRCNGRVKVACVFTLPDGECEMVTFYLKLG